MGEIKDKIDEAANKGEEYVEEKAAELGEKIDEYGDDLQEVLDGVEEDYIDPLKDKIDEYSEVPLSFMKEHGLKVVLGFVALVVVVCAISLLF